jgi:hypothetical protein
MKYNARYWICLSENPKTCTLVHVGLLRGRADRSRQRLKEAHLMTKKIYNKLGAGFSRHDTVNHQEDGYARREGETLITTNTIEGCFSVFKRGMRGTYQDCAEKHLHRYLAEFDFRQTPHRPWS